jgi:hypothetical protein
MKYRAWVICLFVLPSAAFAGPTSAPRKSQFEMALNVIIASTTPDVFTDARESLIDRYEDGKPNKALAVQPVYRQYFRSEHHEQEAVAGDRTLEACQLRFAKPCALIAVNDAIVAEGQLIYKDMPRLAYSGQFDLSQIPIVTLATRSRADVQSYWGASEPKAIAIHPWGRLFISTGSGSSNEAQDIVLTKCNNDFIRDKKDGPCFLYAINNDVVLPERRTRTK